MKDIIKTYLEVPNGELRNYKGEKNKCTHLLCSLYYSKGGMNYWTSRNEERGYYASISPVTLEGGFERYVAFTGCKDCIVPCARQSKGKENEAVAKFNGYMRQMIDIYFPNSGITYVDPVAA